MKQSWLVIALCAGCTEPEPESFVFEAETDVDVRDKLALVRITGDATTLAIGDPAHRRSLEGILDGGIPPHVGWISITVRGDRAGALWTTGVTTDLADPRGGVTVAQTYLSPCNPALEDFSTCRIHETYTAGEPGLEGHFELKLGDRAIGAWWVNWQGVTLRFGEPAQHHGRGFGNATQARIEREGAPNE